MPRTVRVFLGLAGVALLAGCSTPATGADPLPKGTERVEELAKDATSTLPPTAHPVEPFTSGTVSCRRKLLGYAVGNTGDHRVEAPILVNVDEGTDVRALLDPIAKQWETDGFTVDRDGLSDERYPRVRATTPDGYDVVATAILIGTPRLDLYAVSKCLPDA